MGSDRTSAECGSRDTSAPFSYTTDSQTRTWPGVPSMTRTSPGARGVVVAPVGRRLGVLDVLLDDLLDEEDDELHVTGHRRVERVGDAIVLAQLDLEVGEDILYPLGGDAQHVNLTADIDREQDPLGQGDHGPVERCHIGRVRAFDGPPGVGIHEDAEDAAGGHGLEHGGDPGIRHRRRLYGRIGDGPRGESADDLDAEGLPIGGGGNGAGREAVELMARSRPRTLDIDAVAFTHLDIGEGEGAGNGAGPGSQPRSGRHRHRRPTAWLVERRRPPGHRYGRRERGRPGPSASAAAESASCSAPKVERTCTVVSPVTRVTFWMGNSWKASTIRRATTSMAAACRRPRVDRENSMGSKREKAPPIIGGGSLTGRGARQATGQGHLLPRGRPQADGRRSPAATVHPPSK